jgi:peptidyl-prolyl cis-trans isomerase SurA
MKLFSIKFLSFFLLFCLYLNLFAQKTKVDGIAAVVGNEIILDSDVNEMLKHARSQGYKVDNKCEFLENILMNKILLTQAKQDTLIQVSKDEVKAAANQQLEMYIDRAGSEKALLEAFQISTLAELRNEMEIEVENQQYIEQKRASVTKKSDITPYELKTFFEKHKDKLPKVQEEYALAHIVLYPELSENSKQKLIDKLNAMKKDVEEGISTFENKAKIYSEDPGSASNGGLYQNVRRGKMVKEFDAVAFNLEEGQISNPFPTEFGYHIIKLEKRKGQILDLRHILIKASPNQEEIKSAKQKLDSIRTLIKDGKLTFKEVALKFSNDKESRFNSGEIADSNTRENKIEKDKLSSKEFYQLVGVEKGQLTDVFEDEFKEKKALRLIKLNEIIPEHQLDLTTDYAKLKNIALNQKRNELLEKWIIEQIPNTSIIIQKDYKDCDFQVNWLNDPNFKKKEEVELK